MSGDTSQSALESARLRVVLTTIALNVVAVLIFLIVDAHGLALLYYTAGLAGLAACAHRDAFLAVRGFAAGSNALPLLPSPFVLLYLIPLITLIPALSAAISMSIN